MFFVWLLLYETAVMHVHTERESKSEHKAEGVGEEEAAGGWGGGGRGRKQWPPVRVETSNVKTQRQKAAVNWTERVRKG